MAFNGRRLFGHLANRTVGAKADSRRRILLRHPPVALGKPGDTSRGIYVIDDWRCRRIRQTPETFADDQQSRRCAGNLARLDSRAALILSVLVDGA